MPGVEPAVAKLLLDAGFRTVEEVSLASLDDLTGIDGVDEDMAIAVHDAAEQALEERARLAEQQEEQQDGETDEATAVGQPEPAASPESAALPSDEGPEARG